MKTTINFGKVAYSSTRKVNAIDITIELRNKERAIDYETLKEVNNVPELSICGNIWNSTHTDCESCGQNIDTISECLPHNKKVSRIKEIWEEYHLNDLNAGTKKQMEFLKPLRSELKEYYNKGYSSYYEYECKLLKDAGLYEDNGFKFGHGWLYRPIPENIINEIKAII